MNRSIVIVSSLVGVVLLLTLVTYFGDYLFTAAAKPAKNVVQINASKIIAGGKVEVMWGLKGSSSKIQPPSKALKKAYPFQKVELIVADKKGKTKTYTVLERTENDGIEGITIPKTIALGGSAIVRLTPVDASKKFSTTWTDSAGLFVSTANPNSTSSNSKNSGSSSSQTTNSSSPFSKETESDGRKIKISVNHSELISGQKERITVTYSLNHWPGTYKGRMEVYIGSPDISNFNPGLSNQSFYEGSGQAFMEWLYEIPNGGSQTFSFDVKVPPKGYKGKDSLEITAQMSDTYGPRYLNQDGTAPEGPIDVNRGNSITLPIN